ncbi:MAG: V-type ATP synthase subunit F [Gemmatimonadales bacterium]
MNGLVEVICRPATAPGFALAGLDLEALPETADPEPVLRGLLDRRDLAVLLVEEPILDAVPAELKRRLDRSARPIVVPFPSGGRVGARSAEERVIELLRRTIGYRVRLQ